jgi:serine protease Do
MKQVKKYVMILAIVALPCLSFSQTIYGLQEPTEDQKRKSDEKYITTDLIVFDLEEGDVTEEYFKSEAKRRKNNLSQEYSNEEEIKEISDALDNYLTMLLVELNYLDTTDRFFPDYKNSLHLDMKVEEIHFTYIKPKKRLPATRVYMEMVAEFKLSSYYGKELVKKTQSREIILGSGFYNNFETEFRYLLKDMMYEFIFADDVQSKTESDEYFDLTDESTFSAVNLKSGSKSSDVKDWRESVATVISKDSHGSACVISEDGYLLTNYHVVGQNEKVRVKFMDNTESEATVIRKHPDCDLALIKVERTGLKFLTPSANKSNLGDVVYIIGTPADTLLSQSVSKGVLSGQRDFDGAEYLQTDAKVNPGNSGGALINSKGELIGVVSSKYIGFGIEGIGFAVPISKLEEKLKVSSQKSSAPVVPASEPSPSKKKKK